MPATVPSAPAGDRSLTWYCPGSRSPEKLSWYTAW